MQFQELENPVQNSLCHGCTSPGFITEMMSVKPAKGRILCAGALGRAFATRLRKRGGLLFEMIVTDL